MKGCAASFADFMEIGFSLKIFFTRNFHSLLCLLLCIKMRCYTSITFRVWRDKKRNISIDFE